MNEDNWIMEAAEQEANADVSAGSISVKQTLLERSEARSLDETIRENTSNLRRKNQ